ncbi:MAG: hypothetical protein F4Y50_04175 [Dehalococcoidia bacterium]|nr:hypothetical protein [Dehalococcoidia bacterium]
MIMTLSRNIGLGRLAIVAAIAALVFAIACGDDATEPVTTVETSKLIEEAVTSAQSASAAEIQNSVAAAIAEQPQGASAAEIQKLVSDSVTAAIAAQPAGLTRADVQSIVSQSTEGQLSAADVQAIVDQSFRALPAPEIDVSRLTSLVNSAVAGAVPEGVSADEISNIVQAQVSAGLSGTLTRGDIEDLVAHAVEDAVGDQLTAEQVTEIVNASLVATNQAIESAAAEAAQAAAAASAAQAAAAAAMEAPTPSGPPVQVVATTNFVADWARVVGGDRAEVFSLLQPGADPHTFLPGARDVARVADADLVLTVGLDLEAEWLEDLVHNASADESKIVALGEAVDPIEFDMLAMEHDDHEEEGHDDHEEEGHDHEEEGDDHGDEGHDDHDEMTIGRLLVADAVEAHLSVIDLSTDGIDSGVFEVAAPRATVYPSPTHRFGIILARGPEDDDDRIHVFDGGIFLEEHGDHFDLVTQPVSRHSLEIAEERPIHYVNSHGWTAIFADAHGHAILINEADLANSSGDYEPVEFEAGPQHGAALVISDDHVVITTKNLDNLDDALPVGVEVRDFHDHVVYDASNRSCPGMHGESHNEHGAAFGCVGGVLFLEAHDGEYEHHFIPNPPEMREDSRIGSVYGHHHVEHFFGRASYRGDQGFVDDGIWLIEVDHSEMHQVFSEPSVSTKFSSDGELLYVLGADGVLHALDAHDGDLVATLDLVEPGDAGRPAMIVVGEWLYVADPNGGHVLGVHLPHMEIEEEWELGGAPSSLAFLGVTDSGDAPHEGHDEHEEEGHDEHEEEGHDEHDEHEEDEHGHDHDHGTHDPHFWFDPIRVKVAVNEIAARLSAIDPDNASVYFQNASEYADELDELHYWILDQVGTIEPERRLLVTSHDAFTYFAQAYGFEIVGLVIPSLATHVEPSAEHIAELVEVIREREIQALFGETTVSERLAQAVARETGAELFRLYSGSLGPEGSGADTYLGMVRANVETMVEALK